MHRISEMIPRRKSAKITCRAQFVDRYEGACSGWYNYQNSGQALPIYGFVGSTIPTILSYIFPMLLIVPFYPARLIDVPGGIWLNTSWRFQSFVVIEQGQRGGKVLVGLYWGFNMYGEDNLVIMQPYLVSNYQQLVAAIGQWNIQAAISFASQFGLIPPIGGTIPPIGTLLFAQLPFGKISLR